MLNFLSFFVVAYLYLRFLTHVDTNYDLGFAMRPSTMAHRDSNVTVMRDTDIY